MSDEWGGAQWVLATLLTMQLVLPVLARIGRIIEMEPATEFWGRWGGRLLYRSTVVGILAWGGFWS